MTLTLGIVSAVVSLTALILLLCENSSLRRKVRDLKNEYSRLHFKHTGFSLDASFIPTRTAWVRDRDRSYEVYVERGGYFFILRSYTYDPADPDDQEYKRIHAREVADLLNEKP